MIKIHDIKNWGLAGHLLRAGGPQATRGPWYENLWTRLKHRARSQLQDQTEKHNQSARSIRKDRQPNIESQNSGPKAARRLIDHGRFPGSWKISRQAKPPTGRRVRRRRAAPWLAPNRDNDVVCCDIASSYRGAFRRSGGHRMSDERCPSILTRFERFPLDQIGGTTPRSFLQL